MEIRVLKYFLVIAREGSITHAANKLHVSQPTLSKQLKELEHELDCKLFIRGSHSVTLTPEGERFRKRVKEILAMVDKTTEEFKKSQGEIIGDIFIGCGETWVFQQIGELFAQVHSNNPNIRLRLHSGNYQSITSRLEKGLLDFGVVIHPADISKYNYITLPEQNTWGLVMKKEHPLAQKKGITKQDLLTLPLIVSEQVLPKNNETNTFLDWFGGEFTKLNIISTFSLSYNAGVLARVGLGNVLTLDNLVDTSEESDLCFRPLTPILEAGVDVIWKKDQIFSPAAELLLNRLTDEFGGVAKAKTAHTAVTTPRII